MIKLCNDDLGLDARPFEERRKLTVIVAMKESDDSLLIAADSMNIESDQLKADHQVKLHKHDKENIVWGFTGNRGLGRDDFSPWLKTFDAGGDWQKFKIKVADKLAELNGEQRNRSSKAGIQPSPESTITCLLVGWLNNKPQILEFTDDGRIDSYLQDSFRAIGGGMVVAHRAYGALLRVTGIEPLDKFKIIVDTTIKSAAVCGGIPFIQRVKRDGIEDIK